MTKISILLAVIVSGLLLTGCSAGNLETGTLDGTVTIGPIWPVEPPGGNPPIPCEVYEARKVMIYDKNGSKLVKKVDLDCKGYYSINLNPSVYTVDINHVGIDRSPDVPTKIEIRPGETVELDIDIDTGIR